MAENTGQQVVEVVCHATGQNTECFERCASCIFRRWPPVPPRLPGVRSGRCRRPDLDVEDRIIVMNNGKIEQIGTPDEVYENPKNPFVYDFLGNVNIFRGRLQNGKLRQGQFEISAPNYLDSHDEAVGYVRPHDIQIEKEKVDNETVAAKITFIHIVGPTVQIELKREDNGEFLEAELTKEHYKNLEIQKGDIVYVRPKQLKVFIPEDFSI